MSAKRTRTLERSVTTSRHESAPERISISGKELEVIAAKALRDRLDSFSYENLIDQQSRANLRQFTDKAIRLLMQAYPKQLQGRQEDLLRACDDIILSRVDSVVIDIISDDRELSKFDQKLADSIGTLSDLVPNPVAIRNHMDQWYNTAKDAHAIGFDNKHIYSALAATYGSQERVPARYSNKKGREPGQVKGVQYLRDQMVADLYISERNNDDSGASAVRSMFADVSELYGHKSSDIKVKGKKSKSGPSKASAVSSPSVIDAEASELSASLPSESKKAYNDALANVVQEVRGAGNVAVNIIKNTGKTILDTAADNRRTALLLTFAMSASVVSAQAEEGALDSIKSTVGANTIESSLALTETIPPAIEAPQANGEDKNVVLTLFNAIAPNRGTKPNKDTPVQNGQMLSNQVVTAEAALGDPTAPVNQQVKRVLNQGNLQAASTLIMENYPGGERLNTASTRSLLELVNQFDARANNPNLNLDSKVRQNVRYTLAFAEAGIKMPAIFDNIADEAADDLVAIVQSAANDPLKAAQAQEIVSVLQSEDQFAGYTAEQQQVISMLLAHARVSVLSPEETDELAERLELAESTPQQSGSSGEQKNSSQEQLGSLEEQVAASEAELNAAREALAAHSENIELQAAADLAERGGLYWERTSEIMHGLIRGGLDPFIAAAFVGNFVVETGRVDTDPLNPARSQFGGGPGRGLAQWEEAKGGGSGRADLLYAFAARRDIPWDTIEAQTRFVHHELSRSHQHVYNALMAIDGVNVNAASDIVLEMYEVPYVVLRKSEMRREYEATRDKRRGYANGVYEAYVEAYGAREIALEEDRQAVRAAERQLERDLWELTVAEAIAGWRIADMPNGNALISQLQEKYDNVSGRLSSDELVVIGEAWGEARLHPEAAVAFRGLNEAFKREFGHDINITGPHDAYRSFDVQQGAVDRAKEDDNQEKLRLLARPGTSNHGWGMAVDISDGKNVITFDSAEYAWLTRHGWKFGFHNPDWAIQAGEKPEAWHWEFAGIEAKTHDDRQTAREILAAQAAAEEAARREAEEQARREAEAAARAQERSERSETAITPEGWAYPVKSSDSACGFDCYKNHRGMDIRDTAMGEPFYSIREGVVVHAGVDDQMNSARCAEISANIGRSNIWKGPNQVVRIRHEVDGVTYETRYSHLGEGTITVSEGDTVHPGQMVGKVGLTGCTTGVHAHIDIKKLTSSGWQHVDPTEFFGRSW